MNNARKEISTLSIRDMREVSALFYAGKRHVKLEKTDKGIFFVFDDTNGECSGILQQYHAKELSVPMKDAFTKFDEVRDIIFDAKRRNRF